MAATDGSAKCVISIRLISTPTKSTDSWWQRMLPVCMLQFSTNFISAHAGWHSKSTWRLAGHRKMRAPTEIKLFSIDDRFRGSTLLSKFETFVKKNTQLSGYIYDKRPKTNPNDGRRNRWNNPNSNHQSIHILQTVVLVLFYFSAVLIFTHYAWHRPDGFDIRRSKRIDPSP